MLPLAALFKCVFSQMIHFSEARTNCMCFKILPHFCPTDVYRLIRMGYSMRTCSVGFIRRLSAQTSPHFEFSPNSKPSPFSTPKKKKKKKNQIPPRFQSRRRRRRLIEGSMVSFKGKETKIAGIRILDENQAPKNRAAAKDFKMRDLGKAPTAAATRKSGVLGSSAVATAQIDAKRGKGKVQLIENSMGKCSDAVKIRTARKALADVSNLNCNRTNQLSNKPRITKESLQGINKSRVKTATTGNNAYRPRISLTKSVLVANASSKLIRENVKSSGRAIQILKDHGKTAAKAVRTTSEKEKTLSAVNRYQGRQNNHPHESAKYINQGMKLSRPRLLFASQRALDGNTLSRKPVGSRAPGMQTNIKLRRAPIIMLKSDIEKSPTTKPCEIMGGGEQNSSSCSDNVSVTSQGCAPVKVDPDASSFSHDQVKVVISRSNHNSRKSYTSSLVARSEIMGEISDSANFIKEDALINIDDSKNPLEVVEYVDDIYQYYWTMEVQNSLSTNYMVIQSDVSPRMRGILVNWLIEVHHKFNLMQETLFLMVELLDRVLSVIPVQKDELQMVGLTSLLLASKYEDYWHPKINELISISANLYTRDQMLAMEKLILKKLRFRLNMPTPYVFMLRFLKAAQSDKKLEDLAFYLIELCLMEYEASKYRPSLLCASAIYVARCTLQIAPAWTGLMRKHARYEESQLRDCAEMILRFHKAAHLKPRKFSYEKFLTVERCSVATLTTLDVLPS